MEEESIKLVLQDFGLTETEGAIYLFLSKYGVMKGTEIAKRIKKDKAQVYHVLRSLQAKGFIVSTIESPVCYTPVAFEGIVESAIKEKRADAERIQNAKQDLVNYWKSLSKNSSNSTMEKFVVIEDKNKIYRKITQMIEETKRDFSSLSTVSGLLNAYRFGIFDSIQNSPMRSSAYFRVLIELTETDLPTLDTLLKAKPNAKIDIRGKTPDLAGRISPSMVLRDKEELMVFVNSATPLAEKVHDEICFWTNCKVLVQSFVGVFKGIWQEATNIEDKVKEIEAGKISPRILSFNDAEQMKKLYEVFRSAKEEVIIVTSEEGLTASLDDLTLVKDWVDRGVSLRIMAPLTAKNSFGEKKLSKLCDVGNIAAGHLPTVLVDGQYLFQARSKTASHEGLGLFSHFHNTIYSDDFEYLKKTKNVLDEFWKNSQSVGYNSHKNVSKTEKCALPEKIRYAEYAKILGEERGEIGTHSQRGLIDRLIAAQRAPANVWDDIITWYGSHAVGVVHLPEFFCMSDLVLSIYDANKRSSFGEEDFMIVNMWVENVHAYVPMAVITDNLTGIDIRRRGWGDVPAAQNIQCVNKDEFQVHLQGNTLLAGWTVPIALSKEGLVLPPASILFEGYGKIYSGVSRSNLSSGRKVVSEYNGFEAKATFNHQASKYCVPATDGLLAREIIVKSYPPSYFQTR